MIPHPEGGYFSEIYRSGEEIPAPGLPDRYAGSRSHMTSIYFLLKSGQVSKFHRLKSDETWYFHSGNAISIHIIHPDGAYQKITLGFNDDLQATASHGSWFGASVSEPDSYSLVSCAVAPGFDYVDFEMAGREGLISEYPQHKELIELLT